MTWDERFPGRGKWYPWWCGHCRQAWPCDCNLIQGPAKWGREPIETLPDSDPRKFAWIMGVK